MKRVIIVFTIVSTIFNFFAVMAEGNVDAVKRKPLTKEERNKRIAQMRAKREARIQAEGGWVMKPAIGNVARIVSAQNKVDVDFIRSVVDQFNSGLLMYVEVTSIKPEGSVFETLERAKKLPRTGTLTLIVDDEKLPRIVSAMEDGWSILNIRNLDEDLPPKDVYQNRVRKEINRAFAQSFGVGLSYNRPCVMAPAYSLYQIDGLTFPVISPEAMSKIQEAGNLLKIDRKMRTTYKDACQEGWAPQPTNDIQRAIWKEVREMPTRPIKIKFDSQKDK